MRISKMILTVILVLSVLLNIGLAYILIKSERANHFIERTLDKHGLIKMNDVNRSEFWALQGWTNSISKQHTQFDVAFLGNSLTYNSDFQESFPNVRIINLGVSGNTLKDMLRRIDLLEAAKPKKVFIMAGANDFLVESVEQYILDYAELVITIKERLPETEIFIQSMLPMNEIAGKKRIEPSVILEANKQLKAFADKENITYIDLYSLYAQNDTLSLQFTDDGLHLKPKAYDVWSQAITKYLNQ